VIRPPGGPAAAGPLFFRCRDALEEIDRASYVLVVAAMGGMAVLVSMQVFFRYALASLIDWADEVSRLFFVWAMFLAIPHGIRFGVHVGIDVAVRRFGVATQALLFRAMAACSGVLMVVVFVYATQVVGEKWQELMPTINITAAVYYLAVLICAGHAALHLAILAWGGPRTWDGTRENSAVEQIRGEGRGEEAP